MTHTRWRVVVQVIDQDAANFVVAIDSSLDAAIAADAVTDDDRDALRDIAERAMAAVQALVKAHD